ASAATGIPLASYAACADSVMVCYSKGLGAPVGSAIAGTKAFIQEARGARKMLGGAMRQAGILAAGAIHALRHHVARLASDHARAKRLAESFAETEGLTIDPDEIETNIVIASVTSRRAPGGSLARSISSPPKTPATRRGSSRASPSGGRLSPTMTTTRSAARPR